MVLIITLALVQIQRAKLFKNVKGLRANRCSMVWHVVLLTLLVVGKCMDVYLTCSFYSDFCYHLVNFALTMLIVHILLMTNRPPKSLKSTPIESTTDPTDILLKSKSLDWSTELTNSFKSKETQSR